MPGLARPGCHRQGHDATATPYRSTGGDPVSSAHVGCSEHISCVEDTCVCRLAPGALEMHQSVRTAVVKVKRGCSSFSWIGRTGYDRMTAHGSGTGDTYWNISCPTALVRSADGAEIDHAPICDILGVLRAKKRGVFNGKRLGSSLSRRSVNCRREIEGRIAAACHPDIRRNGSSEVEVVVTRRAQKCRYKRPTAIEECGGGQII